jgi:hypothetical protein
MEAGVNRWVIQCSGHVIHQRTDQEGHQEGWVWKVGHIREVLKQNRLLLWEYGDGKPCPKEGVGSEGSDIRCSQDSLQGFLLYWEFPEF